jgi:predicted RNA-binding protein with PIN domain
VHYLIDGHNLIGKVADIHLEDPDDEVALVLRLRRWAAKGRKRQVVVIFDRGLPGGKDKGLSTGNVKVIFASSGQSADALLIGRIQRVKNPGEYTLVSSDQRIRQAAQARRMPQWRAEEFAARMAEELAAVAAETAVIQPEDPSLSTTEVDMWLKIFGVEEDQADQDKGKSRRRRPGKKR